MQYIPRHFAETDRDTLHQFMRDHNFATLFSSHDGQPTATHLPFSLDSERNVLSSHFARANGHWRLLDAEQPVLVVFQGAHSHISAHWYDTPSVVPTWNYAAVHVVGRARIITEPQALKQMVKAITHVHEPNAPYPAEKFPEHLLSAIVGVEITIDSMTGKFKFNQNRSEADQRGVIHALEQSDEPLKHDVASIMRDNLAD